MRIVKHVSNLDSLLGQPRAGRAPRGIRRAALLVAVLGLLLGLTGLGLLRPGSARAATTTITTCDYPTLASAIASASGGDTLVFGCSGTITLTSTLVINKNLTLDGSGQSVTLSGNNSVRVLFVNDGVSFTLKGLTVANGDGGDGLNGDGLATVAGTVTIINSTFVNNTAPIGAGGGLFNASGTVTVINSTFANNSASNDAGGGLYNGGTLTIIGSTFADNTAADGGGLFNTGPMTIANSTFANNSAPFQGGGLLSANQTATIISSTIASNTSARGGGVFDLFGTVNFSGSIVASNSGSDCYNNGGVLSDQGYNLSSDNSCGFTLGNDVVTASPGLASSLANNGGRTQTLALLPGSPAIDAGNDAVCAAPPVNGVDQRGVARPQGAHCDIGAFELVQIVATTLTLASSPAQPTLNQSVTLTATVNPVASSPNTPTGMVSFSDGATLLGTAAVGSNGQASLTTSAFTSTIGTHPLSASYGGDSHFTGSNTGQVYVLVTPPGGVTGANFSGANLSGANLSGQNLTGTNLNGATLTNVNLNNATLTNANLKNANLTGANLSGANLSGANLSGANLTNANLQGAITDSNTNFNHVTWSNTTCPDGTNSTADSGTCIGHL